MKYFGKFLMAVVMIVLITPAPLLIAPQKAHAQWAVVETGLQLIKTTISAIANVADEINSYLLVIKNYVLEPLAFVLSGNLLRSLTAGVINFVNGQGNGTGQSQYVQNLRGQLANTGDVQMAAFFAEFGRNSNSPFNASILSALHTSYQQGSSAAGYWAANQCTLQQYSQNPQAFLGGDFRQGGWGAWFALTTQGRNDPYAQYYRAQYELSTRVSNAVTNQLQQLSWGQGFMSWCGTQGSDAASDTGFSCPAGQVWDSSFQTCTTQSVANSTQGTCPAGQVWNASFQTCTSASVAGATNANCTKKDGTPGNIQTPGSVIHDALNKALGTNVDKLINMGDASGDINSIFNSFSGIMQTLSYGAAILGGSGGAGGGLFGANPSSGSIGSASTINSNFSNSLQTYGQQATQQANSQGAAAANQIQSGISSYNPGGGVVYPSGSTQTTSGTSGAAPASTYSMSQIDQGLNAFASTMTTSAAAWAPIKTAADATAAELQNTIATCSFWAPSAQPFLTNNVAPIQTRATNVMSAITSIQSDINTVRGQFSTSVLNPILIPIVQQSYANLVSKVNAADTSTAPVATYGAQLSAFKSIADAWQTCPA